ncbi:MAG TPA: hypothetical protein VGE40_13480 [Bacilli bacterium]
MEDLRLIFCCNCDNIVSITSAQHVFRTGFYRIKYPLGCCVDCAHASAFAELAAGGDLPFHHFNEQDRMDETDGYV